MYGVFCDDCKYYQKIEQKVLIIKFAAVGDVLRTTSILPAIADKHPHAAIYWITSPASEQIFVSNPHVYAVLTRAEIYLPLLETMKFDAVYNLEADHYSGTLAARANADRKLGFVLHENGYVMPANELGDEWFLMGINDRYKKANKKTYFRLMHEYCNLPGKIAQPKIYLSNTDNAVTEAFRREHNLSAYKKVLGFNIGAGKRWPLKKWGFESNLQLLEGIHKEHGNVAIVLFGGPDEAEINIKLKERLSFQIIDAGTNNSLRRYFALMNAVDILFTPDSLAMQVGVALAKTVIAYTGPTSYTELDMFGNGEIVHSDIDCLVCYLTSCSKEVNCMNTISVETMFTAVKKYL